MRAQLSYIHFPLMKVIFPRRILKGLNLADFTCILQIKLSLHNSKVNV